MSLLVPRRLVQLDANDASDVMEVRIAGEKRCVVPPGDGSDHAVDQTLRSDASLPASAVDAYGAVKVGGCVEVVQVETQQQAAQIRFPGVAARAGHDLHDDRLAVANGPLPSG